MTNYNGWQYLLIDAANCFGLDKLVFEERIQWAEEKLDILESLADQAEVKPLYSKAVMAIRRAQQGMPTGHMVAMDGCCSGIQIMSVLTGCEKGAESTGLINPNVRSDAYTLTTDAMNTILGSTVNISRADAKQAVMTAAYGSRSVPKQLFGEDTPELAAFYKAAMQIAPGAWELLEDLRNSWKPYALEHQWKLPDGFDARVKVMSKRTARVEVDELKHATFTYEFYENKGAPFGLSNIANVVHSVDAYVVRTMHRRCNYDPLVVRAAHKIILDELATHNRTALPVNDTAVSYYANQYARSTVADTVILPYLNEFNVRGLTTLHLEKLLVIIEGMLQYQPFELLTIHDAFLAHANSVNWVRWQYKEILADIADSDVLDDLLSQLYEKPGTFTKLSSNLGDKIRLSNYALS